MPQEKLDNVSKQEPAARNPRLYTSIKQRLCRAGATLAFADDGATSEVSLVDLRGRVR